jgi:hypothetical protein
MNRKLGIPDAAAAAERRSSKENTYEKRCVLLIIKIKFIKENHCRGQSRLGNE